MFWQSIFKCNEQRTILPGGMLSYYIVPVWLNYPSNLANGHLAGFNSDYAIDAQGRGEQVGE